MDALTREWYLVALDLDYHNTCGHGSSKNIFFIHGQNKSYLDTVEPLAGL